jgi:hypothetical protein
MEPKHTLSMVLSEIANALLLTYVATEYTIRSSLSSSSSIDRFSWKKFICQSIWHRIWMILFIALHVGEHYYDYFLPSSHILSIFLLRIRSFLESLYHIPKIILIALLYVIVLYVDCHRRRVFTSTTRRQSSSSFLKTVGMEFLIILPLYPFMAVVISCGFMLLVGFCETLHLPIEWLNWPIYYGTLYGPFSLVYFRVKRKMMIEDETMESLPYQYRYHRHQWNQST